ncbi:hypothetical protein [Neobacillus sp. PS2-9]|uniref:hypothetical protein n=1 Tax=Neobacillus sp. PS2-9 TaxID=3070676 RepID=UPI0027E21353|nr:hypothetical protein [Neobacillus sp. PS2-9]WML56662.1 hypothetical protein RCG25_17230 [Neobacillus sp. PS2-9]
MLVKFMDLKEECYFFQKEFSDISPILLMIEARSNVNIFLDPQGAKRVFGRFHSYEYNIELSGNYLKESLMVRITTDENTVNIPI